MSCFFQWAFAFNIFVVFLSHITYSRLTYHNANTRIWRHLNIFSHHSDADILFGSYYYIYSQSTKLWLHSIIPWATVWWQCDVCVFFIGIKCLVSMWVGVVFNNSAHRHSWQTSAILPRNSLQPSALCSRSCISHSNMAELHTGRGLKSNNHHHSAWHRPHRRFMRGEAQQMSSSWLIKAIDLSF